MYHEPEIRGGGGGGGGGVSRGFAYPYYVDCVVTVSQRGSCDVNIYLCVISSVGLSFSDPFRKSY